MWMVATAEAMTITEATAVTMADPIFFFLAMAMVVDVTSKIIAIEEPRVVEDLDTPVVVDMAAAGTSAVGAMAEAVDTAEADMVEAEEGIEPQILRRLHT